MAGSHPPVRGHASGPPQPARLGGGFAPARTGLREPAGRHCLERDQSAAGSPGGHEAELTLAKKAGTAFQKMFAVEERVAESFAK